MTLTYTSLNRPFAIAIKRSWHRWCWVSCSVMLTLALGSCDHMNLAANRLQRSPTVASSTDRCSLKDVELLVKVKPAPNKPPSPEVLEQVKRVLENRINGLGIAEAKVTTVLPDQVLIQLPGISDPANTSKVLGQTAQLEFRPQKTGTEKQLQVALSMRSELLRQREQLWKHGGRQAIQANAAKIKRSNRAIAALFTTATLTGANLVDAYTQPTAGNTVWEIGLRFNSAGADQFAELTKRLAGTGRAIGIFVDEELISAPVVDAVYAEKGIIGGNAMIMGSFTAASANNLAVQLRAGALPSAIELVSTKTVNPINCQTNY